MASKNRKDQDRSGAKKPGEAAGTRSSGDMTLENLGLSTRIIDVLEGAGLATARDLTKLLSKGDEGEAELLAIRGIGQKSLEEVLNRLAESGLSSTQEMSESEADRAVEPAGTDANTTATKSDSPNEEPRSIASNDATTEIPFSFIVKVIANQEGSPLRTEVMHTKGEKEIFPALDGQRLVDFIEASIAASTTKETTGEPTPPKSKEKTKTKQADSRMQPTTLIVSAVRVLRSAAPHFKTLSLSVDEDFLIEVEFQITGPEAVATEEPFEVNVIASDVMHGTTTSLGRHVGKLSGETLSHTVTLAARKLPVGIYRLIISITVEGEKSIGGYYEGPAVQVLDARSQSSNPVQIAAESI